MSQFGYSALKNMGNKSNKIGFSGLVNSFCLSTKLDLERIKNYLKSSNYLQNVSMELRFNYLRLYSSTNEKLFHTFFFANGPVVHWGKLDRKTYTLFDKVRDMHLIKIATKINVLPFQESRHDFRFVEEFKNSAAEVSIAKEKIKTLEEVVQFCKLDKICMDNFTKHEITPPDLFKLEREDFALLVPKIAQRIRLKNMISSISRKPDSFFRFRNKMITEDLIIVPKFTLNNHNIPPDELLGISMALEHSVRINYFSNLLKVIQKEAEKTLKRRNWLYRKFMGVSSAREVSLWVSEWSLAFEQNRDNHLIWEKIESGRWFQEMCNLLDVENRRKILLNRKDVVEKIFEDLKSQRETDISLAVESLIVIIIFVDLMIVFHNNS